MLLFSLACIFTVGMLLGWICKKIGLPELVGMILAGILLGPYGLGILDASVLGISAQLRKIALIIILMRAGLSLNLADLKQVGRPAVLMCFLPACFEMAGMVLIAPKLLGISWMEAVLMGSVVAAVSPAVIVPKMLKIMEEGYGIKKGIPQMILAGASVDDVFVIVMFSAFTGLAQGRNVSVFSFGKIPVSICLGIAIGFAAGYVLSLFFSKIQMEDTKKVLLILCISFYFVTMEDVLSAWIPFSSLLGVMSMGLCLQKKKKKIAENVSVKFDKLWVGAQIILFVLVGATIQVDYAMSAGIKAVLVIGGVLLFRMLGVLCCLAGTILNKKERMFCMIAYMPKATVQAAIGGIPLSMGLACGNIILTVAVVAILITAPVGAFMIDLTYKRWLVKEKKKG